MNQALEHLIARAEQLITRIEAAIAREQPAVTVLFVKPQTPATWKASLPGAAPRT